MGFKGGVSRLSEIVVDILRTAQQGHRIEITSEQPPDGGTDGFPVGYGPSSIYFREDQPQERRAAFLRGVFVAGTRRQILTLASAVPTGFGGAVTGTSTLGASSLVLRSDAIEGAPYGVGGFADTSATLDARTVDIRGGFDAGGKITVAAGTVDMSASTEVKMPLAPAVPVPCDALAAGVGFTGTSTAYKSGGMVTLHVDVSAVGAPGGGVVCGRLPAGYWPRRSFYFFALDIATAGQVPMLVQTSGIVQHVFGRAAGAGTTGAFTFAHA